METAFSHYKSMGICSRAANSVVSGQISPKFKFIQDFTHVLVICKYKKDRIKNNREKVATLIPHYKSMGAFCCHGNQSFLSNPPQNLMQPFPHSSDATHKIWSRLA